MPIERTCEQCGTIFLVKPSRIKHAPARYCSRSCMGQASRGENYDVNMRNRRKYVRRHPERVAAHHAVRSALRTGELQRGPCEECGTTKNIEAHHDDHARQLDVRWLCRKHHRELHRIQGDYEPAKESKATRLKDYTKTRRAA